MPGDAYDQYYYKWPDVGLSTRQRYRRKPLADQLTAVVYLNNFSRRQGDTKDFGLTPTNPGPPSKKLYIVETIARLFATQVLPQRHKHRSRRHNRGSLSGRGHRPAEITVVFAFNVPLQRMALKWLASFHGPSVSAVSWGLFLGQSVSAIEDS